jgi:hypothetical protein
MSREDGSCGAHFPSGCEARGACRVGLIETTAMFGNLGDFSTDLRAASVADPDGKPVRLVQCRTSATDE